METPIPLPIFVTDAGRELRPSPATSGDGVIPCYRCGVCCERWQPLLTPADAAGLAAYLGATVEVFHAEFTTPYPFDDERRLLRQEENRCIFLRYQRTAVAERLGDVPPAARPGEETALHRPLPAFERSWSGCAVHDARPAVCREWAAGLAKKECVDGLTRYADDRGRIPIGRLYPDAAGRAAFLATIGP